LILSPFISIPYEQQELLALSADLSASTIPAGCCTGSAFGNLRAASQAQKQHYRAAQL